MKKFGKIIIFTGSKGGCGQSFIANCVANYLAIKTNYNILMIDMNTGSRDSRTFYHITNEEIVTPADICHVKKKPSIEDIKNLIVNFGNSLSYIFPPLQKQDKTYSYMFIQYLFRQLANIFDLIVVDCDMLIDFNIKNGSIFDLSDELMIVSLADKISVSNLNLIISYFLKTKESLSMKVIINKYNIRPAVSIFRLNSLVRYPVSQFIPYDRDIENLYLTKGPSGIFKYNLKIVKDISQLAEGLTGVITDPDNI